MANQTARRRIGSVEEKIAFVTGAGSGIGRSACVLLAKEGARVVAADINDSQAAETLELLPEHEKHLHLHVDVADEASVAAAVEAVKNHFGRPADVIVNSAGIMGSITGVLDLDLQEFRNVLRINVEGTFLVMRAFVKALRDAKMPGSVINISSAGAKMANARRGHYAASKGAVSVLTKAAAKEWTEIGVRCNAVLPGLVDTPMTQAVPDAVRKAFTPMGRAARPEEIAEVIVFMASDRSSYITGSEISVTGALIKYANKRKVMVKKL